MVIHSNSNLYYSNLSIIRTKVTINFPEKLLLFIFTFYNSNLSVIRKNHLPWVSNKRESIQIFIIWNTRKKIREINSSITNLLCILNFEIIKLRLLTLSNRTISISNSWIFSSFNCVCSICSSSLDSKFFNKNYTSSFKKGKLVINSFKRN